MQYYVVLDGDTLNFQKTKPDLPDHMYITAFEESESSELLWEECSHLVKKIQFLDPISPVSTKSWFLCFHQLESFDKTNLDLSRATVLTGMFYDCERLRILDLSGLDTSKVTSMENIFCRCDGLTDVDLTGWDTSNVKNFQAMFGYCHSLSYLDISSFSMESAINISDMFSYCVALKALSPPKQFAKQRLIANHAFERCMSLRSIDLSAFGKLSEWKEIFSKCWSLTDVRVFANNLKCLEDF